MKQNHNKMEDILLLLGYIVGYLMKLCAIIYLYLLLLELYALNLFALLCAIWIVIETIGWYVLKCITFRIICTIIVQPKCLAWKWSCLTIMYTLKLLHHVLLYVHIYTHKNTQSNSNYSKKHLYNDL